MRGALVGALLLGSVLAFGGEVWWYPPVLAAGCVLVVLVHLAHEAASGRVRLMRSPGTVLLLGVAALGVFQLVPLPAQLAARHSVRAVTGLAADGEPTAPNEGAESLTLVQGRVLISADRPATLRWVVGLVACAAVMAVAGHHVDRVARLRWVWGSVVVGFGVCTLVGALQLAGGSSGAYGLWSPGSGPAWAPSRFEVAEGPSVSRLRPLESRNAEGEPRWLVARLDPTPAIGALVAGPGAYLALGALAIPLAFALALHRVAPRGSREPLGARLRDSGGIAPLLLLLATGFGGCALTGYLVGGPGLAAVLTGVGVLGLANLRGSGTARMAAVIVLGAAAAGFVGHALAHTLGPPEGSPARPGDAGWAQSLDVQKEAVRMGLRFPVAGVGLGGFDAIYPQVKRHDARSSHLAGSVLQFWAETGVAGGLLIAAGLVWAVWRLPGAWRRVGTADRALAGGMLGTLAAFAAASFVHWTVALPCVAVAAAAVAGTINRWLAGGTDLFLEAGSCPGGLG
jgi:hypothetical protein